MTKEFKGFQIEPKQTDTIVTAEEAMKLVQFARLEKEVKAIRKRLESQAMEAMKADGTKKVDNVYFTATYVAPTERVTVDTEKLKSDGLYDQYTKTVPVKESVRLKIKEV